MFALLGNILPDCSRSDHTKQQHVSKIPLFWTMLLCCDYGYLHTNNFWYGLVKHQARCMYDRMRDSSEPGTKSGAGKRNCLEKNCKALNWMPIQTQLISPDHNTIDWLHNENKFKIVASFIVVLLNVCAISAQRPDALRLGHYVPRFGNKYLTLNCLENKFSVTQAALRMHTGCCRNVFEGTASLCECRCIQEMYIYLEHCKVLLKQERIVKHRFYAIILINGF